MAYSLYLYKDISQSLRLEIHRKDWMGPTTEIRAMGPVPLSLVGLDNRGSDVLTPIVKSTLHIDIKDLGEIDYQELFTSYATKFKVIVKQYGRQVWGGYLTPDSYSQDIEYRTSINLVARDNLGLLDQMDYDWFGPEDGDSFVSIAELIQKAQERIEWAMNPIEWRSQSLVASDGTKIRDSYINLKLFQSEDGKDNKTWFEVLESVLSSIGQQLRYVGNNTFAIIDVSNLYEIGANIQPHPFDYTIGGAAGMEITPSWKQIIVKQDYGLIKNAIDYNQNKDYFEYKGDTIYEEPPYPVRLGLYRNNFFKYFTYILDENNTPLEFKGPLFHDNFRFGNAATEDSDYYNAFLFALKESDSSRRCFLPFNTSKGSGFVFQASVYPQVYQALTYVEAYGQKWDVELTSALHSRVYPRFSVSLRFGVNQELFLADNQWVEEEHIIEFDLKETSHDNKAEAKQITINILNTPQDGELRLNFYTPKTISQGHGPKVMQMVVMKDLIFRTVAYQNIDKAPGKQELTGITNKTGNVKESVDIIVGEIPAKVGDYITYAGGLFNNMPYHKALTGWHRSDNKGGVLHLSELIGRGYAHHFTAFRNINNERTGGKIITGTVLFSSTALFGTLFQRGEEKYIINAATLDMLAGTAEVDLRQVLPYVHDSHGEYKINAISAGGGSVIGGGNKQVVTWGEGGGTVDIEPKRTYELPSLYAAERAVLLADVPDAPEAMKLPLSKLIDAKSPIHSELSALGSHTITHDKVAGGSLLNRYGNVTPEGHVTEDFHPHGGRGNVDFDARHLSATDVKTSEDITSGGNVQSEKFASGPLGAGWRIDREGNGEMESLVLRRFLEAPEFRKNKISVIGDEFWVSAAGLIESVRKASSLPVYVKGRKVLGKDGKPWRIKTGPGYIVRFKMEEGDSHAFKKDDILVSKFEQPDGFQSAWFRVLYVLSGREVFVTALNDYAPQVAMSVARQGNFTDPARQNSIYISGKEGYIRVLSGVNSTEIRFENIRCQYGNLEGLTVDGIGALHGYGEYSDNAYKRGVFLMQGGKRVEDFVLESIETLQNSLGGLAFEDKVEKALLGNTIISGGYIRSELIAVDDALVSRLVASDAFIAKLTASEAFVDRLVARAVSTQQGSNPQRVELNRGTGAISVVNSDNEVTLNINSGEKTANGWTNGGIYLQQRMYDNELHTSYHGADKVTFRRAGYNISTEVNFNGMVVSRTVDGVGQISHYYVNGINLPRGARLDMPGVIAAGKMTSHGDIATQWGCKNCTSYKYSNQTGKYRIYHNLGHTNYFVQATPSVADNTWAKVHAIVLDKLADSCAIAIYDSGTSNDGVDIDFEFLIVGDK